MRLLLSSKKVLQDAIPQILHRRSRKTEADYSTTSAVANKITATDETAANNITATDETAADDNNKKIQTMLLSIAKLS